MFLALGAGYLREPISKDLFIRETCARYEAEEISAEQAIKKLRLTKYEYNLNKYCLVMTGSSSHY